MNTDATPKFSREEEGTFELSLDEWSQLCSIWSEGVLGNGKSMCKGPGVWSGTAPLRTSRGAWCELSWTAGLTQQGWEDHRKELGLYSRHKRSHTCMVSCI